MAVPQSSKFECLLQESEALKHNFKYAIQPKNLKAFFECAFLELSPRELQELPKFSDYDREIGFYILIKESITEVNDNVFRLIETDEHLKRYLAGVLIDIEKLRKKLSCFLLGKLSENEIIKRLSDERMEELFEDMHYIKRIKPPKDPNFQPSQKFEITGKHFHSGSLLLHFDLTMKYVWSCYRIEVEFERFRRHVNELNEKHGLKIDNKKNETKKPENNTSKPVEYCISKGQIVDLHNLCETEKVIESMDFTDFLNCFDLNNKPNKTPVFLYKKMFVFVLSNIDGMKSSIALQNFGFTNYDKNKSDLKKSPMPKSERVTLNKIASILKPLVKVISK
ncbi:hypothetical protein [uncultured Mucilaginibacter sp.]|uniref:hypothetical protein n=1 Tax=uncultured Mucilaginibacter sp. TaxID=797541 RepID=UPI0025D922D1|nr:hypothetical protein [uncultured Mucilaginibacter sp.]